MLRNGISRPIQKLLQKTFELQQHHNICTGNGARFAQAASLYRQGKIMKKLFGNRVSGSKKHWYPDAPALNVGVKASPFAKPSGNVKNITRRMAVLNKLFMQHITDLLATGEASEAVTGRGLQITRVKIAPDFTILNVYWLGSGDAVEDGKLEEELRRCSGVLRHDLSQLTLMGEVPRIIFVRDKTNLNLHKVQDLLSKMDLGPDDSANAEHPHGDYSSTTTKNEFFGQSALPVPHEKLPAMRHDVLGLDHREVMSKILTKMRKSKQAWDSHSQGSLSATQAVVTAANDPTVKLERVNLRVADATKNAEEFERFLAQRRKNNPNRKRYFDRNEWTPVATDDTTENVLTAEQRRLYEEQDYIHEEHENEQKS